ncbi:MAG: hypothetical protein RL641_697 [Candidatus Parcubacteria bacterium]|jgi:hypothetical protein
MRRINSLFPPYKLISAILTTTDKLEKPVDALFFFGRVSADANDLLFNLASKTYHSGAVEYILINGLEAKEEYGQSKAEWVKKLNMRFVKKIEFFEPAKTTAQESRHMVAYAKKKGWKSAVVLAQPHQLARCMRALIRSMKDAGYWMKIYCISPKCNFFEKTAGSQNLFFMERWKHIGLEYSLIQGVAHNLATYEELVEYYRVRESIR